MHESVDKRIKLPDDELLGYCYLGDYGDATIHVQTSGSENSLNITHIGIYALVEKCGMDRLKTVAKNHFSDSLCTFQPIDVIAQIPLVYSSTPSTDHGLRDVVAQHVQQFCQNYIAVPEFKIVLIGVPDFCFLSD